MVAFGARGDNAVGAAQELADLLERGLEVGLAEGGGQLDVEHLAQGAVGGGRGPDLDVTEAIAAFGPGGEQFASEDPLHGLVEADVEGDADRVRVLGGVEQARYQRDRRLLGNDEPETEFGCYGLAAVHRLANLYLAGGF